MQAARAVLGLALHLTMKSPLPQFLNCNTLLYSVHNWVNQAVALSFVHLPSRVNYRSLVPDFAKVLEGRLVELLLRNPEILDGAVSESLGDIAELPCRAKYLLLQFFGHLASFERYVRC